MTTQHKSDCATSNAPAEKPGPCDCGAELDALVARYREDTKHLSDPLHTQIERAITALRQRGRNWKNVRECRRCRKRVPISQIDAEYKEKIREEIASVMNASRARYGLRPLRWDD